MKRTIESPLQNNRFKRSFYVWIAQEMDGIENEVRSMKLIQKKLEVLY